MGMAASQARLLTITARMHDVEYQAQSIQSAKIQLANQEDAVYQRYLEALDATTFTVKDDNGNRMVANFNTLCGIDAVRADKDKRYVLRDEYDNIIVSDEVAQGYESFKKIGGNAYEFALFMMEGQPEDFNADAYRKNVTSVLDNRNKTGSLGDKLLSLRDQAADKLLLVEEMIRENTQTDDKYNKVGVTSYFREGDSKEDALNKIRDDIANAIETVKTNADILPESEKAEADKILGDVAVLYEEMQYLLYTQSGEDIYDIEGNRKEDFDNDDFWGYVNMYKQIEANGGRYIEISEFDGMEGVGDAATNSDWLQSQVQSGKITIDVSSLDKKGNLSFKSTAVSSDSALEYTTTTTLDKAAAAKAEAEYEHKMKEIDRKDKKFDMDLNKLETERSALKTEYDSVKKVIEDNIERTFGIFS